MYFMPILRLKSILVYGATMQYNDSYIKRQASKIISSLYLHFIK